MNNIKPERTVRVLERYCRHDQGGCGAESDDAVFADVECFRIKKREI